MGKENEIILKLKKSPELALPPGDSIKAVFDVCGGIIPVYIDYILRSDIIAGIVNRGQNRGSIEPTVVKAIPNEHQDYDDGPQFVYKEMSYEELNDTLRGLHGVRGVKGAYNLVYLPLINAFNIVTEEHAEDCMSGMDIAIMINSGSRISGEDEIPTSLEDYLKIISYWWYQKKVYSKKLTRPEEYLIKMYKVPVAAFNPQLAEFQDLVVPLINKTILAEHLIVDTAQRSQKSNNIDLLNTKIYWTSFKNAMEFLGTDDYRQLTPPNILECLLANEGYITSRKFEAGSRMFEYVGEDMYGLKRYKNLIDTFQEAAYDANAFDDLAIGGE